MSSSLSVPPQLRELGGFLRTQRNSLEPRDLGIRPGDARRRVSGLRREEVAERANISADYYARIEQGRLAPSAPVLESLIRVLRLDDDQIDYVRKLVEHAAQIAVAPRSSASRKANARQKVRPQLQRLLNQLIETPALVLGPRMEILAWNSLAECVYLPFSELPAKERNFVRLIFIDRRMRTLFEDWEAVAKACIAIIRREAASNPDDPGLAALVGELTLADDQFGRWWSARTVTRQDFGTKVLRNALVGDLTLDWDIFRYASAPEQQLVINSAAAGSETHERLATLRTLDRDPRRT